MYTFYKLWLHFNTQECPVGCTGTHHASQSEPYLIHPLDGPHHLVPAQEATTQFNATTR